MTMLSLYQYSSSDELPDWGQWWESMLNQQEDTTNAVWPIVRGGDDDPGWCGEWQLTETENKNGEPAELHAEVMS